MSLLHVIEESERRENFVGFVPHAPPVLTGIKEMCLNFETSGLKWWEDARPIAASYLLPDGRRGYISWGHRGGGNIDEPTAKRWFHEQVKNIHITNINTKFEVHQAREWGVDLEAQGCTVSDVAHWAALLDDHRKRFALDVLACDFIEPPRIGRLDESRMADYHAGEAAPRSIYNVELVAQLKEIFWQDLTAQDLHRVRQLEDECIFAVAEMEKNAIPVDVELLHRWCAEAEQKYLRYLWTIHRETGVKFSPSKADDWERLLHHLKIDVFERTANNKIVTQYESLKRLTDHPMVHLGLKAMKLGDLRSDFLEKYKKTVGADGLLRFSLHQCRSDEGGTISGRFSASAIKVGTEKIGCNPQQVPDIYKQVDKGHDPDFIIRKLFLMDIAADAAQIEYRLFANYARSAKVLEAYKKDPNLSFHRLIYAMILPHKPGLIYEQQKNLNFMKIYGGGLSKLAFMLGHITETELNQLRAEYAPKSPPRDHPKLRAAAEVDAIYARELPEVKPLIDRASKLAETRGYVMTIEGRRMRFPGKQRLHKALNGIIQGGAADVMKRKMIEVHKARKKIGLIPRVTVHDEIAGSKLGDETPQLLKEILNEQSYPQLEVPIMWDVKTGANWAEC